jgi:Papain family cysteine protease
MYKFKLVIHTLLLVLLASCSNPTPPVQKTFKTGVVPTDEKILTSLPFDDHLPGSGVLPENVDLSISFPTPGDQGQQSSCTAWASAYLKTYQEVVETGQDPDDVFFSPAFIYNQIKASSCDLGSDIVDALNLLSEQGDVGNNIFAYDPNDCDKQPTETMKELAEPFRIASWRRANTRDATEIKRHIANATPVLIAFETDSAFFDLSTEVYKNPPSDDAGLHAMIVVAYDDTKNAFKVINSWGTSWGESGFGWIDYDTFIEKTPYGFVAQDLKSDTGTGAPIITSFTSSPSIISEGGSSTLRWGVSGEKPIQLTLITSEGLEEDVTDVEEFTLQNVQQDITVTLEAENSQGKISQALNITVGSPFKLNDIRLEPDSLSTLPFSTPDDDNRVVVNLDYEGVLSDKYAGLRIWTIPYTDNNVTPSSFYDSSDIVTEREKIVRFFGVNKSSVDTQSVDAILIWVEAVIKDGNEGTSQEKRERFYSELVEVEFTFTNNP